MIIDSLSKIGFSQDEIGGLYYSRMIAIARKAALYDQIQKQNIEAKRVKPVPKSSKPAATTEAAEKTHGQKSMDRLRKTGKLGDAQAAIRNLILGG